jgi:hypothetical protein
MSRVPVRGSRRFRETYYVHFRQCLLIACFMPVSCLTCSSTRMKNVMCSSESSIGCLHTSHYIPDDGTLYNHRSENVSFNRNSSQNHWASGLCQSSGILNSWKQRFGKWICFRPQERRGETPTLSGPLERANLNQWRTVQLYNWKRLALSKGPNKIGVSPPLAWGRKQISLWNTLFSVFRIPDDWLTPDTRWFSVTSWFYGNYSVWIISCPPPPLNLFRSIRFGLWHVMNGKHCFPNSTIDRELHCVCSQTAYRDS